MKVEIFPRAETDIIRQFRYYLVHEAAPAVAFRFREAVIQSVEQRIGSTNPLERLNLEIRCGLMPTLFTLGSSRRRMPLADARGSVVL